MSDPTPTKPPIRPRSFAIAGSVFIIFGLVLWLGFDKTGPVLGFGFIPGVLLLVIAGMEATEPQRK